MNPERDIETRATPEAISVDRQQMLGEAVLVAIAFQGGIEYPNHDPKACFDDIQGALSVERQRELTAELTARYPEGRYLPAQLFQYVLASEVMSSRLDSGQKPEPWIERVRADDKLKLQLTNAGNLAMMDIYQRITDGDEQARDLLDEVVQRTAPADN